MKKSGFTLVELIVTIVLISLVMIFLFNLLSDLKSEDQNNNYSATYGTSVSLLNEFLQNKLINNYLTSITGSEVSGVRTIKLNFNNTNYLNIIVSSDDQIITLEEKDINGNIIDYEKRQLPTNEDATKLGKVGTISAITRNSNSVSYTKKYLTTFKIIISDSEANEYPIEAYYASDNNLGANITLP